MKEIVSSPSKQLSVVTKEIGTIATQAILTKAVFEDLSACFKVKADLNDNDVIEIVTRILKEYWHLKLEDIKACFYNARGGRYNQNYNKLEVQVVMRWIEQYDKERQEEIFRLRTEQASEHKIKNLSILPPEYITALKETLKKVEEKPIYRPVKKRTKDELFTQRLAHARAIFDEILINQESDDGLIEQNGKRINFNQFILEGFK